MPDYECPNCHGGFPDPKPTENDPECPWCGEPLNGESSTDRPADPVPSRTANLIDPPTGTINTGVDREIKLGPDDVGTTPCPDCGDPMPFVTWSGPKPKCRKCRGSDGIGDSLIQSGDTT